jgi:quinol monooxygenase YgiN
VSLSADFADYADEGADSMIVVRFALQCKPEKAAGAEAVFRDVVIASRKLNGVVSFDMGRDLADPNMFVATEVFDDRDALDRQEALPEAQKAISMIEELAAGEPEATIFHVSSSEPWG